MANRIYPAAVIAFWLATMSWLVAAKVAPALRQGDPPDHHVATVKKIDDSPPVIWTMQWDFREIGWAASWARRQPGGRSQVVSRVQFTDWPQTRSTVSLLMTMLTQGALGSQPRRLRIDNRSLLDADGQLQRIESAIFWDGQSDTEPWVRVEGNVRQQQLRLNIWLGQQQLASPRPVALRRGSLVANEMSPRGFMPPLQLHQEWTTYHVNPLHPGGRRKIIQAKVELAEPINWDRGLTETLVVVYREDSGAGSRTAEEHLGKLWVRPEDGMVLKQEVVIMGAQLIFTRRPVRADDPLVEQLKQEWSTGSNDEVTTGLVPVDR